MDQVYCVRAAPSDSDAERASDERKQRSFCDDPFYHCRSRYAHQAKCCAVSPPLFHLEKHDTQQEDRARDEGDEADRFMKPADYLECLRCLDSDVARAVCFEAERGSVYVGECFL